MTVVYLPSSFWLLSIAVAALVVFEVSAIDTVLPTRRRIASTASSPRLVDKQKYIHLRKSGVDEVGHTEEAAALRSYRLREKRRKGLFGREAAMAEVLFPSVEPESYRDGEHMIMYSDMVSSKKTQMPFSFGTLPFCADAFVNEKRSRKRNNIGARLLGHHPMPSPFHTITVKKDLGCVRVCQVALSGNNLRFVRKLIERQYRVFLSLDDLPVLMRSRELNYAVRGYPVGFKAPPSYTGLASDEYFLYNHLRFTITYHEDPSLFEGVRITGFDVHPVSIQHSIGDDNPCDGSNHLENDPANYLTLRTGATGEALEVLYSYEVEWIQSNLPWADRWDVYVLGSEGHLFSLTSFVITVLLLLGGFSLYMVHTLKKDITAHKKALRTDWTVLKGEVFRPPRFCPTFLSALIGTGAQIGLAAYLTLFLSMLELLNVMSDGDLLTAALVLYALCGFLGGFVSARYYKYFEGICWKQVPKLTATAVPGPFMLCFVVLNLFLTAVGGSTAASIATLTCLIIMWLGVMTPLVFVGCLLGFKMDRFTVPTATHRVARLIPDQPWYSEAPGSFLLGGILPFVCIYKELRYVLAALWLRAWYFETGCLLTTMIQVTIVCAQVSVFLCYRQLRNENHRWWWNSFFNCATSGLYLFLYSLWHMLTAIDLRGLLPVMIFCTYMGMISVCFGLYCGAVGVVSSFWFNKTIYRCAEKTSSSSKDETPEESNELLLPSPEEVATA